MTTGQPLAANPAGGAVPGSQTGPVPIIRLYGVTMAGNSVCAHCYGFTPYFFAELPANYRPVDAHLGQIREVRTRYWRI